MIHSRRNNNYIMDVWFILHIRTNQEISFILFDIIIFDRYYVTADGYTKNKI